jgi:hypothetical protein
VRACAGVRLSQTEGGLIVGSSSGKNRLSSSGLCTLDGGMDPGAPCVAIGPFWGGGERPPGASVRKNTYRMLEMGTRG